MTTTNDKIFIAIDCDDVVADFTGYAHMVLRGEKLENGYRFPDEQWKRLKDNPRMYRDLPLKIGARELINWCKKYVEEHDGTLAFLTAMPRKGDVWYAFQDKVHWVDKHFPGMDVFFGPRSEDKQNFCKGHNSILIDDRADNCERWREAGGRAFQYKNWEECKQWLEQEL
jgi:hypothetical protein